MSTSDPFPDFHSPVPSASSPEEDVAAARRVLTYIGSNTTQFQEAARTLQAGRARMRAREAQKFSERLRVPAFGPGQQAFSFEYYAHEDSHLADQEEQERTKLHDQRTAFSSAAEHVTFRLAADPEHAKSILANLAARASTATAAASAPGASAEALANANAGNREYADAKSGGIDKRLYDCRLATFVLLINAAAGSDVAEAWRAHVDSAVAECAAPPTDALALEFCTGALVQKLRDTCGRVREVQATEAGGLKRTQPPRKPAAAGKSKKEDKSKKEGKPPEEKNRDYKGDRNALSDDGDRNSDDRARGRDAARNARPSGRDKPVAYGSHKRGSSRSRSPSHDSRRRRP
mmetsp:Transcript_18652/g.60268  ORF Transcript_18652/g.60268 Transcript_18652/m.60268 type:complete len:348 (-) Transcript_18652:2913-3956(-)